MINTDQKMSASYYWQKFPVLHPEQRISSFEGMSIQSTYPE